MSAKQPTKSKRKKKGSKSLLVRLSESCTSHKNTCHHHDDEHETIDDNDDVPSDQCSLDMNSLKKIIPIIEAACQCRQHERERESLSDGNNGNSDGNTSTNATVSKKAKENVDPKEVMHLCLFYISVVECTYCPHAMNLLFDNGSDGLEIFPRVHQLFRHLASDAIVQDTIKHMRRSNNITNTNTKNTKNNTNQNHSVSDHISHTCAILLNSIPKQTLQMGIAHDLIQLLQDLVFISSIGVLDDPSVDGEDIEVSLFSKVGLSGVGDAGITSQNLNKNEFRYGVCLGADDRLLMLQSSIYQIFIHLLTLQYNKDTDPAIAIGNTNANFSTSTQSNFLMGDENCTKLLKCIRQVLETSSNKNTNTLLSLRTKSMACGLLHLLIPQYCVGVNLKGARRAKMMELVDSIISGVRSHFDHVGGATGTSKIEKGVQGSIDAISLQYISMLRTIFINPIYIGMENQNLRPDFVHRLFDCVPNIVKTWNFSNQMEELSRLLLQSIQMLLTSCDTVNSSVNLGTDGSLKNLQRLIVSIVNYCKVNSLFHYLVTLLRESPFTTIMTSIMAQLWCQYNDNFLLSRACKIALTRKSGTGNKRRKLHHRSKHHSVEEVNVEVEKHVDSSYSSSFTPTFISYLQACLEDTEAIISCTNRFDGDIFDEKSASDVLKCDGVLAIFNVIFLLEYFLSGSGSNNKDVPHDNPMFSLLARLYEGATIVARALASRLSVSPNDKGVDGGKHEIYLIVGTMCRIYYYPMTIEWLPEALFSTKEKLLYSTINAVVTYWSNNLDQTQEDLTGSPHGASLYICASMDLCLAQTKRIENHISNLSPYSFQHPKEINDPRVKSHEMNHGNVGINSLDGQYSLSRMYGKKKDLVESFCILLASEELLGEQRWNILSTICFAMALEKDIKLHPIIMTKTSNDKKLILLDTLTQAMTMQIFPLKSKNNLTDNITSMFKGSDTLQVLGEICGPLMHQDPNRNFSIIMRCLARTIALSAIMKNKADLKYESNDLLPSSPGTNRIFLGFEGFPLFFRDIPVMESPGLDRPFCLQIISFLKQMPLSQRILRLASNRRDFWDFLLLLFLFSPHDCVERLSTISIQNDNESIVDHNSEAQNTCKNGDKSNPRAPIAALKWFIDVPFADENDRLRADCAQQLGAIIFKNNSKFLGVICGIEVRCRQSLPLNELVARLFEDIDNKLHTFCGITQSELSLTMKTTLSVGTFASDDVDSNLSTMLRRQMSSIKFISTLCHHAKEVDECRSYVLEKGIMRLFRFWITASTSLNFQNEIHPSERKCWADVATAAFQELLTLRDVGVFSEKSIAHYDETFVPGLISEILSRCSFARTLNSSEEDQDHEYQLLIQFIEAFIMRSATDQLSNVSNDDQDIVYGILNCLDKVLPATIAGLILEQDYESICACTKFRMYLLSELNKLERKCKTTENFVERVAGKSQTKKRQSNGSRSSTGSELKRQTAKLCIMNDSNLNILGPILKALLLESDKAPLIFFLKTVVRSEVSFGQLLESSEFTIVDALLWELGQYEDSMPENDFEVGSWKIIYKDKSAYHALVRAALFLQRAKDRQSKDDKKLNTPTFSLDAQDFDESVSVKAEDLVQHWIQKYFMRLLVNITTKWKRGRMYAKLSSMKCLRVLLRFLCPEEAPQYLTAILGIIDGCMNLEQGPCDDYSMLRTLAVRNLAQYIRTLLSTNLEIVGENLCNIIVSLFPLFDRTNNSTAGSHKEKSIIERALQESVDILELLVEGKIGRSLAPYFAKVPFLPRDPRLQHVRDTLKTHGVNFDNLLLLSTQLSSEPLRGRKHISSSSSITTEEDLGASDKTYKLQMALRTRLHSMEQFLNHENENVRRVCLAHIADVLGNHRALFHSVVKVEDASLRFLTVKANQKTKNDGSSGMDSFIKGLLKRCVVETNTDLRLLLASCLGEIGAISPTYIDRDGKCEIESEKIEGKRWVIEKGAPWKSNSVRIHYELQLLTNHFVTALKAAPTPTDQHKIAFAIQEVLKQLDFDASKHFTEEDVTKESFIKKKPMNPWIRSQLEQRSVYSIIEPYWTSLYKQNEASKTKSPPFFKSSTTYYLWLAEWARFMVERSNFSKRSCYSNLFFACRSALRSEAGLGVIECLLPLLVLDSLCFGDDLDRKSTIDELKSVLLNAKDSKMINLELQRSVEAVFTVLRILQSWAENEVEEQYKVPRSSSKEAKKRNPMRLSSSHNELSAWPPDESICIIEDLLNFVTFDMCAVAAEYVGMHAQALRFLEMASRKIETGRIFDDIDQHEEDSQMGQNAFDNSKKLLRPTHIDGMDIGQTHRLFGFLDDRDSMIAIARCRKELHIFDHLHERQSYNDWDGVLRACEVIYQINPTCNDVDTSSLENFQIKSLLELGHFDSALNQVIGLINGGDRQLQGKKVKNSEQNLISHAINASWRLGRWESLDFLVNSMDDKYIKTPSMTLEPERQYDFNLGKAILGMYQQNQALTSRSIKEARESIIPPLSVVAGEDYTRAYPYLMKLQCLREVEDVLSCKQDRLHDLMRVANSDLSMPMETIAVRLALSRVAKDIEMEASLWLSAGRKARKEGLLNLAESSLSHSSALYERLRLQNATAVSTKSVLSETNANEVRLQRAKLMHDKGQTVAALRMIEVAEFETILLSRDKKRQDLINEIQKNPDEGYEAIPFARNGLQATEWMIESGLLKGSEAIERYELLITLAPQWERAHFKYAKYLDSVLESRISIVAGRYAGSNNSDDESARAKIVQREKSCHTYIFEAIKEYGAASRLSQKHVFQALPRLLTLWFDFTSINGDDDLVSIQEKVNEFMVTCLKHIPAIAYYSVLPQLISRITHPDDDTKTIVCAMLKRQLVKFPGQALWHLSWLRQSVDNDRRVKGEEMFKQAQKSLRKNEEMKSHDLLETSRNLVLFLSNLAKYQPKSSSQKTFNVKQNSWSGKADLRDFLPPVQAALTVSRSAANSSTSRDMFPRKVPRMREFNPVVEVMSSKAKPKKLTAFAIAEGTHIPKIYGRDCKKPQPCDIGEMHFLVKTEAKGDLRKDARVQDLNTVINRLFSNPTSPQFKGAAQQRRLKLRTFSVVCLSEDCGIIEWVPNTDSLRNVVSSSYNPHASHHSGRRRGKRLTNFGDLNLRNAFAQCQEQYTKHGNLTKAAKMFEEIMLKEYPPVLYWWFVRRFDDPHQWFEARTRFALSSAAWAAVGHVIGLGDRHAENILLDTSCGECVHVDFDCIFDKGLNLPRPEVIPFRLTPNMLDAFGATGADGVFSGGLKSAMTTLRNNRDVLLSVLEPFVRDPVIDWKRQRPQQKKGADGNSTNTIAESREAKRSIRVIDERLRGIYNLQNPNHKKIKRIDRETDDADDEMASLMPLSVEGQVHKMIAEATSHENLVQVYVGWMPWL